MSMWELEALAEGLVRAIGRSALPVADKRQLYGAAYHMVGDFDVSFVHFRTQALLVEAQFLLRIDPGDHPDPARRDAIEAVVATGRERWLMREGQAEALFKPDPPSLWFDPTMALWRPCVEAGLLTGLGAEPLVPLETRAALIRFMEVLAAQDEPDLQALKMLHGFGAYVAAALDPDDPDLQRVRDHPVLARALATTHEDWVEQRFDARRQLQYFEASEGAALRWWCAAFG